jgi:hypothetical protein
MDGPDAATDAITSFDDINFQSSLGQMERSGKSANPGAENGDAFHAGDWMREGGVSKSGSSFYF